MGWSLQGTLDGRQNQEQGEEKQVVEVRFVSPFPPIVNLMLMKPPTGIVQASTDLSTSTSNSKPPRLSYIHHKVHKKKLALTTHGGKNQATRLFGELRQGGGAAQRDKYKSE